MNRFSAVLLAFLALSAIAQDSATLRLAPTIPLLGVRGRFDHFAIDAKGNRLFVAALGNNTLEILDLAAGKHLKSIGGLHKPTGVLYLPERNQLGVANGDDGTFKFFDAASFDLRFTVKSLDDADNVRYDSKTTLTFA